MVGADARRALEVRHPDTLPTSFGSFEADPDRNGRHRGRAGDLCGADLAGARDSGGAEEEKRKARHERRSFR
jgi:hypothetical protein